MRKSLMCAVLAMCLGAASTAQADEEQHADVYSFEVENLVVGDRVPGAQATIVRETDALSMTLSTRDLRAGHVHTVWWLTFNAPENCLSNPSGPIRCGVADVFNPVVKTSHIWAAGTTVGQDGTATFDGRVVTGDLSGVPFPWEPGLTNAAGAEVFLVVRDHGPPVDVPDQATSMNGGCMEANVMIGTGTPGPNRCENRQIAMFPTP